MKVNHLWAKYTSLSQTFIYDLINNLEQSSDAVNTIFTYDAGSHSLRPFERVIQIPKLSGHQLFMRKIMRRLNFVDHLQTSQLRLKKIKSGIVNADIIHVHFGTTGYDLLKILHDPAALQKVVISLHGSDTTKHLGHSADYKKTFAKAAEYGVVFIANSKYLKEKAMLNGIPESSLRIVYNSVNPNFLAMERMRPYAIPEKLRLITIGRLIGWKGHAYLIRSLPKIRGKIPSVELSIVGNGQEEDSLRKLAEELGVTRSVHFLGAREHGELPSILAEHHIYVQPSITDEQTGQEESFGVVLLEALAVGLPVVGTNSGGIPEFLASFDTPCVKIVEQKSVSSLARAILELAETESAFDISDPGRVSILRKYSRQQQLSDLVNVYREKQNSYRVLSD